MGTFNTKTNLACKPELIPAMAERICQTFTAEGYEVKREDLYSGGTDISITKGGLFKAVLGMKTALKVTLVPQGNSVNFDAGVGIFGQQVIPTLVMLFITWPVLLTQIWGLVEQAKLDDKALAAAQAVIAENDGGEAPTTSYSYAAPAAAPATGVARFCTNCGTSVPANARFCPNCGNPLS